MAEISKPDNDIAPTRRVRSLTQRPLMGLANAALATLMAFAIIGALSLARDVLIPVALAAVLSFLLAPLVRALRGWKVPQALAVTLVILGTLLFGASLGLLISRQAQVLIADLPKYEGHIREKIRAFRDWESGEGVFDKVRETFSDLGRELTTPRPTQEPAATAPILSPESQPQPQQERLAAEATPPRDQAPERLSFESLRGLVEPVLRPLGEVGLVMLFTVFILLQREDLRSRLIRLTGAGDLNRATIALTDAATRLSRFFLLQATLNLSFGVFVALALWGLNVPAALGFGLFSALMRFVPYIGSVLAALPPIAVAAAIEPGWSTALLVAAVFGIGEPLMGHVIEPLVFGRHTGLSPIAVVGAATFWTWLWGPIGLVLATPLTLCLVVLGQHTRPLRFLSVLLSNEPALTPPEIFYQRLLAGDAAELVWQADTALKSRSVVDFYDEVVLPGLRLASVDGRAGHLDDERQQNIALALDDLVDTLGDADPVVGAAEAPTDLDIPSASPRKSDWRTALAELSPGGLPPEWKAEGAVVIYPGRGTLDFSSARMAADLLTKLGFGSNVQPRDRALARPVPNSAARLELIASVGGLSLREMEFLVRRIKRAGRTSDVIVCAFADKTETGEMHVISSFAELLFLALERARASGSMSAVQRSQGALEIAPQSSTSAAQSPEPSQTGHVL